MKVHQITKHFPWTFFTEILTSGSALGNDEKKAAALSNYTTYSIGEAFNNLEIRLSSNVTGRTGTAYLYAARKDDDICLLGSIAITSGLQIATGEYFYIDTIVLTDRWITEVKLVDGNGNDGMSRIVFDVSGYDDFFIIINYTGNTKWKIDLSGF